jgi:hypothetical protein
MKRNTEVCANKTTSISAKEKMVDVLFCERKEATHEFAENGRSDGCQVEAVGQPRLAESVTCPPLRDADRHRQLPFLSTHLVEGVKSVQSASQITMASLNLSTNGASIKKSYQSIVDGPAPSSSSPTYAQWAVFSVQAPLTSAFQSDSSKESVLKVQTTGGV